MSLEEAFFELVYYGVGIFLITVLVFIMKVFLRKKTDAAIRSTRIPFAFGPEEMGRVRESGLTDEELKAIRQAMARQLMAREEEERRKREESVKNLLQAQSKAPLPQATRPALSRIDPPAASPVQTPAIPTAAQPVSTKKSASNLNSLDLESLLNSGMITRGEYERLRPKSGD